MSLRARFTPAFAEAAPSADEAESRAAARLAALRGRPRAAPAPKAAKAAASVLRPFLKQSGLGFSELQRRWAEIAGEPFASKASPHKLSGGVLTLHAASSIAPFLAHQTDLILERLRLAGAKVKSVRIEQRSRPAAPTPPGARPRRQLTGAEELALVDELARIDDPNLKSALVRLGRAVKLG